MDKYVVFIPVRGGSKSIPLKNIKNFCGKPLVYWTIKASSECDFVDKVYISTDSLEIKNTILNFKDEIQNNHKIEVISRSPESSTDFASTEMVMLEFANKYEFENIALVQATSPLLTSLDLDKAFKLYNSDGVDGVISVVKQKRFIWDYDSEGFVNPKNYDYFNRPRRQDFDGFLVENGAFYLTSKERLMKYKNRLSGNIKAIEMSEDSFFEIDEPSDWEIIEKLFSIKYKSNYLIPRIELFLTDCDGCLTDGGMYYSESGDELKKFNTKDGFGFSLLKSKGILIGMITGEKVELNFKRAQKLKFDIYEAGIDRKEDVIRNICEKYGVNLENTCYIGDDLNDLDSLRIVGFSCAPSDASEEVKKCVDYVTKAKGGEGVIREVADLILSNGII